ncbi:MAG: YabP/YqfC family sporulation protein [Clostridia bacterium]|nr:YabP/YqfC family sporulation protein [Clostridia bacterium]
MSNLKRGLDKLNRCLDLPDGLLSGGARIELQSNEKALIDCKCSVLQYSDNEIKINTRTGIVVFFGSNLRINSLNKESAVISGKILKVEFQN